MVKNEKKIAGKSAMCNCVLTCFVFLIFVFVFTTKYHLVFCAVKNLPPSAEDRSAVCCRT